jgi:hypothetical protein
LKGWSTKAIVTFLFPNDPPGVANVPHVEARRTISQTILGEEQARHPRSQMSPQYLMTSCSDSSTLTVFSSPGQPTAVADKPLATAQPQAETIRIERKKRFR